MTGSVVLGISLALLGITIRNLLGPPSRRGIVLGWVATIGFAGLSAFCFWKIQELRAVEGTAEAVALGQKFMMGNLAALLLSAYSVSFQRLKLRRPGGGPPAKPLS
jgi:hypothetical protein